MRDHRVACRPPGHGTGINSTTMIDYQVEEHLSADEFRELLIKSTLGERRPVDDPDRMETMVRNANLTITAPPGR